MPSHPGPVSGHSADAWNHAYTAGTPPWETNRADPQLRAYLAAKLPPGRRVLELGCGTGTNAVFLAKRGFLVTGLDLSSKAIAAARTRAKDAATAVDFQVADATKLRSTKRFDWAFDRGCYHALPTKAACAKYRSVLLRHLEPRGQLLLLCFSDKEPEGNRSVIPGLSAASASLPGPRRISKADLIAEFSSAFTIRSIIDFRFETSIPGFAPHAYAALLVKK